MEEIDSFAKKHPRQTMVAGTGTSIFLIVLVMMGIYIAFDGKIPNTPPISFPLELTIPKPTPVKEFEPEPISYIQPTSYAQEPISYP